MGVNIIIALGHSGYKKDKEIAEKCPEVDIVVGGHSHTFLYTGEPPDMELPEGPYPTVVAKKNGIQVPVVQAFAFTKYLGKLLVEFDSSGKLLKFSGNPILLDKSIEPRGDIMAVINKKRGMVKNLEEQVIGTTKVFLNGDYQACRLVECNFGNLIADSMVYARLEDNKFQDYWTDASAAIINSGAVRGSITRTSNGGAVTVEDIYQVLPYDSKVIFIKILGKYILRILEHSVQMRETDSDGGFLQVSGMRIKYDLKERKGRRVRSVLILCTECKVPQFQPLDPYKLYGILLTQYLLDEGDGYKFKINERHIADTKVTVLQAVTRYFQAHKLVYPKLENRIMIADNDRTGCSETKRLTYVVFIFSIYILLF
ncbi:snake venom 5'-nucleotidase-like isoform X2 [Scaptodrosophila lebanonensis]|nr:snake venom 5'-nucleotidase-like isoform X2 [Scaptodrosophila lebanonensis]